MAKYNKANGYEADSEVIYGDTDSVMVNFKVKVARVNFLVAAPSIRSAFVNLTDALGLALLFRHISCHLLKSAQSFALGLRQPPT